MLLNWCRTLARSMSTAASYPFSKVAIVPPAPSPPAVDKLLKGKGLMPYLHQTLPPPEKLLMLKTLFSRRSPDALRPGDVLTVVTAHAPGTFSGVLISIRRRGPDTSFVVRNVVQRTGVEAQYFVSSPHLKEIKVVRKSGSGGGRQGRKIRRAKLFYLRDSPEKMTAISNAAKRS